MSTTEMNSVGIEGSPGDGNNTLDPLSLASTIGTWVAAFLAIVALLGVVPIYFAITASMSDKNRAMNAVQDKKREYITRGLKVYQGLRVFRKVRAPNLAPSYATNGDDANPLIPEAATTGLWTLRATDDFQNWNSGWAKLSKIIESYAVADTATNRHISLDITRDGTLEIVNSRTALVVHKHWILLLGLLGRYGHRHDGGILQPRGILRAFPGERVPISVTKNEGPRQMYADDSNSDILREPHASSGSDSILPASDSVGSSHFTFTNSSLRKDRRHSDDWFPRLRIYRQPWGTSAIGEEEKPMKGITGTMQYIGRHKGSWSYLTSIVFSPHTARSIFLPTTTSKSETSPLHILYWLAHGFIPCSWAGDNKGHLAVICLETPSDGIGRRYRTRLRSGIPTVAFFKLAESDSLDIPLSVRSSMQCLGIPQAAFRHFVPVPSPFHPLHLSKYTARILAEDPVLVQNRRHGNRSRLRDLDKERNRHRRWEDAPSSSESDAEESNSSDFGAGVGRNPNDLNEIPISIFSDSDWVLIPTSYGVPWQFYRKRDIEVILEALFTLEWDAWGYLIWRQSTQFWRRLLRTSTGILRQKRLLVDQDLICTIMNTRPQFWVPQWRVGDSFHAKKTAQLVEFGKFLQDHLGVRRGSSKITTNGSRYIKALCVPIAVLFTLDPSFQMMVQRLIRVAGAGRYGRADGSGIWVNLQLLPLLVPLGVFRNSRSAIKIESAIATDRYYKDKRLRNGNDRKSPTTYLIPTGPEVCLIDGQIYATPESVQARQAGNKTPPQVTESATATEVVDLLGEFFYDYIRNDLTWRFRHETQGGDVDSRSWKLMRGGPTPEPGAEPRVSLDPGDVIAIGLWAAVRATLWLSSQDSKPLLEFVSELDHFVYVV